MRRLTSPELKLLLERGADALDEWTAPEVVEALALEVSERRAAESELEGALASMVAAFWADTTEREKASFLRDYPDSTIAHAEAALAAARPARAEGRG